WLPGRRSHREPDHGTRDGPQPRRHFPQWCGAVPGIPGRARQHRQGPERRYFQRPATDLLALRDSVDQEVAELIRKQLGEEIRVREQRQGTSNTQAWALEQRAERSLKQENLDQADTLAAAARQLDPRWIAPILMRTTVAYRHSRQ